MGKNTDGLDKVLTFFRKYLNISPRPSEIYKSIIETYNAIDKKSFHIEEIKLYHENLMGNNFSKLLKFFNYKGIEKIKNEDYELTFKLGYQTIIDKRNSKAIVFLPDAIIGENSKAINFLEKVDIVDKNIRYAIEEKYGNIIDIDNNGSMEELILIGDEHYDKDEVIQAVSGEQWKEGTIELETDQVKWYKMRIFVKGGYKSKAIIIPKKEKEKVYLKTFLKDKPYKLKLFNEITQLSEILEPYEEVTSFYQKQKTFTVSKHFLKSYDLSPKLLKITLRDKGIKVNNIFHFAPARTDNAKIYEIDNQDIVIAPAVMMKTLQDPTDVLNESSDELRKTVNEIYNVNASFDSFHYGNYYRVNRDINTNQKHWQIINSKTQAGIEVEIGIRNKIAKLSKMQVGKYYAKRVHQSIKK